MNLDSPSDHARAGSRVPGGMGGGKLVGVEDVMSMINTNDLEQFGVAV